MANKNFDDMMEANAAPHRMGMKGNPMVKQIEVIHHMTHGEPIMHMVEPGKMGEHMADCPHCSGPLADRDSAAGAAS